MFGCYRRDEAADPDTFVAAVTMVLSRYPAAVVEAITDPFSGLPSRKTPNGYSGLPDVAEVKTACEEEAVNQERRRLLAKVRPIAPAQRLPAPPAAPGAFANVFVSETDRRYATLLDRTAWDDNRCWKRDANRPGLWVSLAWLDDAETAKGQAKRMHLTEDDLRRLYPPAAAPARALIEEDVPF